MAIRIGDKIECREATSDDGMIKFTTKGDRPSSKINRSGIVLDVRGDFLVFEDDGGGHEDMFHRIKWLASCDECIVVANKPVIG